MGAAQLFATSVRLTSTCPGLRAPRVLLGTLVVISTLGSAASAHRLDEYLQAARISVDRAAVRLDLSLAPGVDVAPGIVAAIDANRDGQISAPEASAYATRALGAMRLSLDGQPLTLRLVSTDPVTPALLLAGEGDLRVHAEARLTTAAAVGEHELRFENEFEPASSVYLGNAMLPDDPAIAISNQDHGTNQSTLAIRYRVREETSSGAWVWLLGAAGVLGAGFFFARARRRHTPPDKNVRSTNQ